MHIRRLVKAGQSSHTVSLPKTWLKKNNLKRGDTVHITERSDSELAITPELAQESKAEKKEITIEIDKKAIDTIQREITSAYLNNYSTISIIGTELSDKAKEIRRMLHDFVALEIAEQTSKRIVAKDLLNLKEISVERTIKRMDMIVRTMLEDTRAILEGKELNHESIMFRDYDVNRLYFLLSRLLKNSIKDSQMAESIGIEKENILPHWYLSVNLENLADCIKRICELTKEIDKNEFKKIIGVFKLLEQDYTDTLKAVHSKNKALADRVARNRIEVFNQISGLITKNMQPEIVELAESMKAAATLINSIARIVIDQE